MINTGCVTPSPFSAAVDTNGANGKGEHDEARESVLASTGRTAGAESREPQ